MRSRVRSSCGALETITGIPKLLADATFEGGGMHVTGPGGRLDVHVDFNYSHDIKQHRRLNILVYLNPDWKEEWGGQIELWDRNVSQCHHSFSPDAQPVPDLRDQRDSATTACSR